MTEHTMMQRLGRSFSGPFGLFWADAAVQSLRLPFRN